MDIRPLTPAYAVSPQIEPSDLAAIKAAGYTTIIDNRPDGEIPGHLHMQTMKAAATAMGFDFVAYCASGNRSSVVWAMVYAGAMPADDLIGIPAKYGYQLEHLRPQLVARGS
jgi:protein tyrosine phosphatase (PTP) superfamily phosphohydrolase (DUF442 family)